VTPTLAHLRQSRAPVQHVQNLLQISDVPVVVVAHATNMWHQDFSAPQVVAIAYGQKPLLTISSVAHVKPLKQPGWISISRLQLASGKW